VAEIHGVWKWRAADRKAFVVVARARQQLGSWVGSIECVICPRVFIPRRLDQVTIPAVRQAVELITLELKLVRLQHPEMTPREQLQEAKRRCAAAMVAAADAIEAEQARQRLQEARG
jgi:hypothetical protein